MALVASTVQKTSMNVPATLASMVLHAMTTSTAMPVHVCLASVAQIVKQMTKTARQVHV